MATERGSSSGKCCCCCWEVVSIGHDNELPATSPCLLSVKGGTWPGYLVDSLGCPLFV